MSRLPRAQEYLKTGFTAEAAAAARFRAYARRAERDGLPRLAAAWRDLAAAKDDLAERQLLAQGSVRGGDTDLAAAIAEERYEIESLYPRMAGEVDRETAAVFAEVIVAQEEHAGRLERLLAELRASTSDVRS